MNPAPGPDAALLDAPAITTTVEIRRTPEQVFDLVSNPSLWHTWHPATRSVRDAPPRPLQVGESVLEEITAGGRRFEARWTVLRCERPTRWEISTDTGRGAAHIVYRLQATPAGCSFERCLRFRSHHWPWRWLDHSLMQWILRRQSLRALANLRRVAEVP